VGHLDGSCRYRITALYASSSVFELRAYNTMSSFSPSTLAVYGVVTLESTMGTTYPKPYDRLRRDAKRISMSIPIQKTFDPRDSGHRCASRVHIEGKASREGLCAVRLHHTYGTTYHSRLLCSNVRAAVNISGCCSKACMLDEPADVMKASPFYQPGTRTGQDVRRKARGRVHTGNFHLLEQQINWNL
jgi:hypothetical protein